MKATTSLPEPPFARRLTRRWIHRPLQGLLVVLCLTVGLGFASNFGVLWWVLIVLCMVTFPLLIWAASARHDRLARELEATDNMLCPDCGHPLKGLPRNTRCPECGAHCDVDDARRRWAAYAGSSD